MRELNWWAFIRMATPNSMSKKYKIFFIGKFQKIYDEEYIARSFEYIGHEVFRCEQHHSASDIGHAIDKFKPDIILYTKWDRPQELDGQFERLKREGVVTVCWLFDLYFDYSREYQVATKKFFRSDYVFTTDDGHGQRWEKLGINHQCVRQGIWRDECYMLPPEPHEYNVVFVGSESPVFIERTQLVEAIQQKFTKTAWFGRYNTDEMRGTKLNELFAKTKIVVGDSYPSPHYWSNRVVETLGRGGFLIHKATEGLSKEYPHLVTYKTQAELFNKVKYYLEHDAEREDIRRLNFQWVKDRYTMDKKCAELISKL